MSYFILLNRKDMDDYMEQHNLPPHPLASKGYKTVGDKHLSRPMTAGDADERDTRFKGEHVECGMHQVN
jgi:phosphoadenosine phosphosulfate reductase